MIVIYTDCKINGKHKVKIETTTLIGKRWLRQTCEYCRVSVLENLDFNPKKKVKITKEDVKLVRKLVK